MNEVRIGVIGVGGMGSFHAQSLRDGKIKGAKLAAVCDLKKERLEGYGRAMTYLDSTQLLKSNEVDAVIIATPHYSHTSIGIDALSRGLHVLVEKPLSVSLEDARRLLAARRDAKQVFGIMFMSRTEPAWKKIRHMVQGGELGEIRRFNWLVTDWFRTQAYYDSEDWRGTWKGEGGGILINQCAHNLDALQWILGLPARVRAFCKLGRYHDIEVEDDVTAWLEYPNGASGTFVATTGEAPGSNRLEIDGDLGKLLLENNQLRFWRNELSMESFRASSPLSYGSPETWAAEIPLGHSGGAHNQVTQQFTDAILSHAPLVAEAAEGIAQVELSNALLYSSLEDKTVELPLDAGLFEKKLEALREGSKPKPPRPAQTAKEIPGYIRPQ